MSHSNLDLLRALLEDIHRPDALDSHPWTARPFVKDALTRHPERAQQSPGAQLVLALADFFAQTVPPNPPRRGKRLDTRWAEFGLLAAQYFAPSNSARPFPPRCAPPGDAWTSRSCSTSSDAAPTRSPPNKPPPTNSPPTNPKRPPAP